MAEQGLNTGTQGSTTVNQQGTSGNGTTILPTGSAETGSTVGSPNGGATIGVGSYSTGFKATQGWYITGAIVVSTLLATTPVAPFLLGILGIALIYQTSMLLQHK